MKTIITSVFSILITGISFSQEQPDTTRINLGEKKILIVANNDTIDADPDEDELKEIEAHWAGIEFGPTILLNSTNGTSFPNDKQWENDPGKSFSWNANILEHKFKIYKNYIGITTGLGFNWTQIGLKQSVLVSSPDSLYAFKDTVNTYSKNKLRAIYLTAPLMLEFCSKADGEENSFYLSAGVIGGIRIGSSVKTTIEEDKREVKEKNKGTFDLNSFRLDAAIKLGYADWGIFANYNVLPLFNMQKTTGVYPLTFGLSYNF